MIRKHRIVFSIFFLFAQTPFLWAQVNNTYTSREAFYDNLEARAKALSLRLAEVSGTDPIPFDRPPPTILSTRRPVPVRTGQAQQAFDALPGPSPEPVETKDENILYRADGTPVTIEEEPPKPPKVPRKLMERERGQYFIQPFVGLAFISSDASLSYSSGYTGSPPVPVMHNVDIETQIGHVVGINLGRRWGNIEGELHSSYSMVGYDTVDLSVPSSSYFEKDLPASGEVEVFQVGARIGYALPFGETGWIRAAGGFGFGNRRDFLTISPPTSIPTTFGSSESAFTYDLLFSMGYEMEFGLDTFLAYRLLGSSENGNFGKIAMHLFELGLGANF